MNIIKKQNQLNNSKQIELIQEQKNIIISEKNKALMNLKKYLMKAK